MTHLPHHAHTTYTSHIHHTTHHTQTHTYHTAHTYHTYSITYIHTYTHQSASHSPQTNCRHTPKARSRSLHTICIKAGTGVEVNFFLSSLYYSGSRGGCRKVSWACRCFVLWQAGCGEHHYLSLLAIKCPPVSTNLSRSGCSPRTRLCLSNLWLAP